MFFFPGTKILLKAPIVPKHLIRAWSYIHSTSHLQRDTNTIINIATHVAAGPTLRELSLRKVHSQHKAARKYRWKAQMGKAAEEEGLHE